MMTEYQTNIKQFILIILCLFVIIPQGNALVDIVAYEYFFDVDPGFGFSGNIVDVTDGPDVTESLTVDVSSLSAGFHVLYVRAKDANGLWGLAHPQAFFKEEFDTDRITEAEYFIDVDPGFGSGAPLPGFSAGSEAIVNNEIDIKPELAAGFHTLYIRGKDPNDNWGLMHSHPFFKDDSTFGNVIETEYFIDVDPGFGGGAPLPGFLAGVDVTVNDLIDIKPDLNDGLHYLYVRGKDPSGNWGMVHSALFLKDSISSAGASNVNITSVEYFFDSDPGFDNGHNVDISGLTLGSDLIINFNADLDNNVDDLSDGIHVLHVRSKDANGNWSLNHTHTFLKESTDPNNPPNIVAVHYNVTEAGTERKTPVSFTAFTPAPNTEVGPLIDLTGLFVGTTYQINVESFDSNGAKSLKYVHDVTLERPKVSVSDVTVHESMGGIINAVFEVSLSVPDASVVTVNYTTTDSSANAGTDYTAVSGTLSFPANTTTLTIPVTILTDESEEGIESFFLDLATPVNAEIDDGQGICTIIDTGIVKNVINLNDNGPGSLREAISTTTDGDVIKLLIAGKMILTGGELVIDKNIVIRGPESDILEISGSGSSRVFNVSGSDVVIENIGITNGFTAGSGGGILNTGGLTLRRVVATMNAADEFGGGLMNGLLDGSENIEIRANLIDCDFGFNTCKQDGGGIFNEENNRLNLTGTVIHNNTADVNGGGIANFGGQLSIANSTISSNKAKGSGGGIDTTNAGTLTIIHGTITQNRSDFDDDSGGVGGGIFRGSGNTILHNTIVAENYRKSMAPSEVDDDVSGIVNSASSYNLIGVDTGLSGIINGVLFNQIGTGSTPIIPLLGNLLFDEIGGFTNIHALSKTSPAIDAANNSQTDLANLTTDQRGISARKIDGGIGTATADIGAFEYNPFFEELGGIAGTVVDSSNQPISGVTVFVFKFSEFSSSNSTQTDSIGNYAFNGLKSGDYKIQISLSYTSDFVPQTYDNADNFSLATPITVSAPNTTVNIDITLEFGGSVSGRVVDSSNQPISGLQVNAFGIAFNLGGKNGFTDSNGDYIIKGLASGDYRVEVLTFNNSSFAPQFYSNKNDSSSADPVTITAPNQTSDINFTLAAAGSEGTGGTISGQVIGENGQGVANVSVNAFSNFSFGGFAFTDSNGFYTISGIPEGDFRIRIFPPTDIGSPEYFDDALFFEFATPITITGTDRVENINFVISKHSGSISGKVVDAAGQPLANQFVDAYDFALDLFVGGESTDAKGFYKIKNIPAGTYRVRTSVFDPIKNYINEYFDNKISDANPTPVTVPAQTGRADVNFMLDTGGSISGNVKDANDQPITNGLVEAYISGTENWVNASFTDTNGDYIIPGLPPGNYRVRTAINHSDFVNENFDNVTKIDDQLITAVTVTIGNDTPNINFSLAKGGAISGKVTDVDGNPIIAAFVDAKDAAGNFLVNYARTDFFGNYTITGLPAGDYHVSTDAEDNDYIDEYFDNAASSGTASTVTVAGLDNTPNINFQLDAFGAVSGKVFLADGTDLKVELWRGDPCTDPMLIKDTLIDADGTFELNKIVVGTYYLRVNRGSTNFIEAWYATGNSNGSDTPTPTLSSIHCGGAVAVTLSKGVTSSGINFFLSQGGSISGTITNNSTQVGDIIVQAFVDSIFQFNPIAQVIPDPDSGVYTFPGLVEGDYFVGAFIDVSPDANQAADRRLNKNEDRGVYPTNPITISAGNTLNFTGIDITITPPDGNPIIGFDITESNGLENVTTVSLSVSLSFIHDQEVRIDYVLGTPTADAATEVTDFTFIDGTLIFDANVARTKTITDLVITDDDESGEGNETIIIELTNVSGATLDSNRDTFTYTIIDDESVDTGTIIEDFEDLATFDNAQWSFPPSPNVAWDIDDQVVYEGMYSAKSGAITNNQKSIMELTRNFTEAGTISFFRKIDSEAKFDFLNFYIDGGDPIAQWSGNLDWAQFTFKVAAGDRKFTWEYVKDSSNPDNFSGADAAWIDDITSPGNAAPNAVNDVVETGANTSIRFNVLLNDSDVDNDDIDIVRFLQPTSAIGIVAYEGEGIFLYTPNDNETGFDYFTYFISDGKGGEDGADVEIDIRKINGNPILEGDFIDIGPEIPGKIDVLSNDSDPDGDSLTISAFTQPKNGTLEFNSGTQIFTYTSKTGIVEFDSFDYTVTDGNGGSQSASVDIFIRPDFEIWDTEDFKKFFWVTEDPSSDAPWFIDDIHSSVGSFSARSGFIGDNESSSLSVTLPTTGGFIAFSLRVSTEYTTDEILDKLEFKIDGKTIEIDGEPLDPFSGILNDQGDPIPTDQLSSNGGSQRAQFFNELFFVDPGIHTFTWTYTKNESVSSGDDAVWLDNIVFPNLKIDESWESGDLSKFSWVPSGDSGWEVTESESKDGDWSIRTRPLKDNESNRLDLTLGVLDGIISFFILTSTEKEEDFLEFQIDGVEQEKGRFSGIRDWRQASFEVTGGQRTFSWIYKKDGSFTNGEDRVWLDAITFPPIIDDAPNAPDAIDDTFKIKSDTATLISVLENDIDNDGDAILISSFTQPTHGEIGNEGAGDFIYIPNPGYIGPDQFTYTVRDRIDATTALTDTADVFLTVEFVNAPPTAIADIVFTNSGESVVIDVLINDLDKNLDFLTITAVNDPDNGSVTLNNNGTLTYSPNSDFVGVDKFNYIVSDGRGGTDIGEITVLVISKIEFWNPSPPDFANPTIATSSFNFSTEAFKFNNAGAEVPLAGADWFVTVEKSFIGDFSVRSGALPGNSQSSILRLEGFRTRGGSISFFRKISSENDFDKLIFSINGTEVDEWSGELDWELQTYFLSAGEFNFEWKYIKDESIKGGDDRAWIDGILLPPDAEKDSDDDGLRDSWEIQFFGSLDIDGDGNPANDGEADFDSDTWTDRQEFQFDRNPKDNTSAPPRNLYVTVNGDDDNGTGKIDAPFNTIQRAIDFGISGMTINVADGVYSGEGNENLDFDGKAIILTSVNGRWNTIIKASTENSQGFIFFAGETNLTVVKGFTISGFKLAIETAIDSSPKFENCLIRGSNIAAECLDNSSPIFTGCSIVENDEGLVGFGASIVTIIDCDFINNDEAVISIGENETRISRSRFSDNTIGISGEEGKVIVSDCILKENKFGLIIASAYGSIVRNCTIVNNDPGIEIDAGIRSGAVTEAAVVGNCIIFDNGNGNDNNIDIINVEAGSIPASIIYSCLGVDNTNPLIANVAFNNINSDPALTVDGHLLKGSPCIDAGTNSGVSGNDIDNEPRPGSSAVDIGADEFIDTDNDGLPNWFEGQLLSNSAGGTNVISIAHDTDFDGDNLLNIDEYGNSTNAASRDTDLDRFSDDDEIASGSDPLVADTNLSPFAAGAPFSADISSRGVGSVLTTNSSKTILMSVFEDADQNNAMDLFCLLDDGSLQFIENKGTLVAPEWNSPTQVGLINGATQFDAADLNGDKRADLVVVSGTTLTLVSLSESDSSNTTGNSTTTGNFTNRVISNSVPAGSRPFLVDIDGDGDFDIVLSHNGNLSLLKNTGKCLQALWEDALDQTFFKDTTFNRPFKSTFDIDMDGDLDEFITINSSNSPFFSINLIDHIILQNRYFTVTAGNQQPLEVSTTASANLSFKIVRQFTNNSLACTSPFANNAQILTSAGNGLRIFQAGTGTGSQDIIRVVDSNPNAMGRSALIVANVIETSEEDSTGKAIIIVGRRSDLDSLYSSSERLGREAYAVLRQRGYVPDNICMLTPDGSLIETIQRGLVVRTGHGAVGNLASTIDRGIATPQSIENAIKIWAKDADELLLDFVDHGVVGKDDADKEVGEIILRHNVQVNGPTLNSWLNFWQTQGKKCTVILDHCYSGRFLRDLKFNDVSANSAGAVANSDRIVLASALPTSLAHFQGTEGIVSFSQLFWDEISAGKTIGEAFESTVAGLARLLQTPNIDYTGDGLVDSKVAENVKVVIGLEDLVSPFTRPSIRVVMPAATIKVDDSLPIWVTNIVSNQPIASVTAYILTPNLTTIVEDGLPITDSPQIQLLPGSPRRVISKEDFQKLKALSNAELSQELKDIITQNYILNSSGTTYELIAEPTAEFNPSVMASTFKRLGFLDWYEAPFTRFDSIGLYRILVFAQDQFGLLSPPSVVDIRVEGPVEKAIIIHCPESDENIKADSERLVKRAYTSLLARNFDQVDIRLLTSANLDKAEENWTSATLQEAVTQWALTQTNDSIVTELLTIYLIGTGTSSGITCPNVTGGVLAPGELKTLLDTFQNSTKTTASPDPANVRVIIEADNSGIFISGLKSSANPPLPRQILTSSNATDTSFRSEGLSFSDLFWGEIARHRDIRQAFGNVRTYARAAGIKVNYQLDDNDNGAYNPKQDGSKVNDKFVGSLVITGDSKPVIGRVQESQEVKIGEFVQIWASEISIPEGEAPEEVDVWANIIFTAANGDSQLMKKVDLTYCPLRARYEVMLDSNSGGHNSLSCDSVAIPMHDIFELSGLYTALIHAGADRTKPTNTALPAPISIYYGILKPVGPGLSPDPSVFTRITSNGLKVSDTLSSGSKKFRFFASPGQRLTFDLFDLDANADFSFSIQNPVDNSVLISSDDWGSGFPEKIWNWKPPYTGWYFVEVIRESSSGARAAANEFNLRVSQEQFPGPDGFEFDDNPNSSQLILLQDGEFQEHNFHKNADEDWVFFYADVAVSYRVEVFDMGSNNNPVLELFSGSDFNLPVTTGIDVENGAVKQMDFLPSTFGLGSDVYYIRVKNSDANIFGPGSEYKLKAFTTTGGAGLLKGEIFDSNNVLVTGGNIILNKDAPTESIIPALSGKYGLLLSAGTYTLETSVPGYATDNESGITINGNIVTQNFTIDPVAQEQHSLAVVVTPTEGGQLSTPAQEMYFDGENVNLTGAANAHYKFVSWSGSQPSTSNPLQFTISEPTNITLTFALETHNVTFVSEFGGATKGSPILTPLVAPGPYNFGSVVNWSVTSPEAGGAGERFVADQTNGSQTVDDAFLAGSSTLRVNWVKQYELSVALENSGKVNTSTTDFKEWHQDGTLATLTADTQSFEFEKWLDDADQELSTNPVLQLSMTQVRSVKAVFKLPTVPQMISFKKGWNQISFNVSPKDPPRTIFADLVKPALSENKLLQIIGENKNFDPDLPDSLNTLTSFTDGIGYWFKFSEANPVEGEEFTVNGNPIQSAGAVTIPLKNGWNHVGYVPSSAGGIDTVLASIINNVEEIRSRDGKFVPGGSSNDFTTLKPGEAYFIKIKDAPGGSINFQYP